MMVQALDDFEEEEEYDFWADYSDYSDEQGNTNWVSPASSSQKFTSQSDQTEKSGINLAMYGKKSQNTEENKQVHHHHDYRHFIV